VRLVSPFFYLIHSVFLIAHLVHFCARRANNYSIYQWFLLKSVWLWVLVRVGIKTRWIRNFKFWGRTRKTGYTTKRLNHWPHFQVGSNLRAKYDFVQVGNYFHRDKWIYHRRYIVWTRNSLCFCYLRNQGLHITKSLIAPPPRASLSFCIAKLSSF
jgi:hypothetical protein